MRDIAQIAVDIPGGACDPAMDPMRMRPTDRRAWFQSENERLKFEQEQGLLIPAGEVEAEMSEIAKVVARALATMPDRMERDLRLPPLAIEYVAAQCRAIRSEIAAAMAGEESDAHLSA